MPLVIMSHELSGGGPASMPPGHSSRFVHTEGPLPLLCCAGDDGSDADGRDEGATGVVDLSHAVVTHATAIVAAPMIFHFMIVLSPHTVLARHLRMVAADMAGGSSSFRQFPSEEITGAVNGPQETRILRIGFEFAAQLPHVHVDRAGEWQCAVSPHRPKQFIAEYHTPPIAD